MRKSINSDFDKKTEELNNLRCERLDKLDEIGKKIERYSTFRMGEIGPVIADLFTLYNGEIYEFTHNWKDEDIYEYNISSANNKRKKVQLALFISGGAMLPYWTEIQFYVYDDCDEVLYSENALKYYPYLKEFINFIIKYRFSNKLETCGVHHLKKCLHDFVVLHKDEIEEVQKSVIDEQKGEYAATLQLALTKPYLDRKAEYSATFK